MKTITRCSTIFIFTSQLLLPLTSFALEVEDKAPEITADFTMEKISLAGYTINKHVVLALYFAVFTSV